MNSALASIDAPLATLGEGPMWCVRDRCLYWVDVVGRRVFRLEEGSGHVETRNLPYAPSAIFPRASAGLLLVTKKGLALLDFESGRLESVPVPKIDFSREIFNDGACDSEGRLWIGTRDIDMTQARGALYRITADFSISRCDVGFVISNGIAWSPDRKTMYHVESLPGRIDAYDFDVAAGCLSNSRTFVEYGASEMCLPDGCTVDAEGGLWVAELKAGRVVRFSVDGRVDRTISVPVRRPTSVMFGGKDLATLYITSMRHGLSEEELLTEPFAGGLLAADAGVKGIAEPSFGQIPGNASVN
ncbi:MAG: SMP-30/gluconolactonase/LRE family protein [Betaproteobacteria bacterium]|nr:SMP-30/gluconolactonase/LRE family protein [Betaproteobacteria bacterium]